MGVARLRELRDALLLCPLLLLLLRLQRLHTLVAGLVDKLAQLDTHHLSKAQRALVDVILVYAQVLEGFIVSLRGCSTVRRCSMVKVCVARQGCVAD